MSTSSPNETMLTHGPIEERLHDDLTREVNAEPQNIQLTTDAPQMTQTRVQQTDVQVTTPQIELEQLAQKLSEKKYDRSVFIKWKLSNSKSMEKVTGGLKTLNALLVTQADAASADAVQAAYDALEDACRKYLESHNPKTDEGKARYDLVEKVKQQVGEDIKNLTVNIENVKEGSFEAGKRWVDVIHTPPVMKMSSSSITVPPEAALGGTSSLKKLAKGGKNYYFKRDETVPTLVDCAGGLVGDVISDYQKEIDSLSGVTSPLYGGLTLEQRQQKIAQLEEMKTIADCTKRRLDTVDIANGWAVNIDYHWNAVWPIIRQRLGLPDNPGEEVEAEKKALFARHVKELEKRHAIMYAGTKVARIKAGSSLNSRNEATSVLAGYLGIGDMMMGCHSITLEEDGKQIRGIRMDEVQGTGSKPFIDGDLCEGKKIHMSTEVVKQFTTMQVFDVICGQVDRNQNNYKLKITEGSDSVVVERLTGIDNDMCFGALTYAELCDRSRDTSELKPLEVNWDERVKDEKTQQVKWIPSHKILLQKLDKKFAESVIAMKPEMLKYLLSPYISEEEIAACQDRLKGVQELLKEIKSQDEKRAKEDRVLISTTEEWGAFRDKLEATDATDIDTRSPLQKSMIGASYIPSVFMGGVPKKLRRR